MQQGIKIFHLNCLLFIYKCLFNNSFPTIRQWILKNCPSHSHATRYRNLLKPPLERLEICKNSYLSQSICLWNNLDTGTKDSKSLHILLNKVKSYYKF